MKRAVGVLAVVMILAVAGAVVALDATKCSASTQDCLNMMANSYESRGWVGIEMGDDGGIDKMVVTKVIDGSPAQEAGFKIGDVMMAVNGVAFSDENEKKLKDVQHAMKPGADFTYTVSRHGSKVNLDVELGKIPDNVKAQLVGKHMLVHADYQVASAK